MRARDVTATIRMSVDHPSIRNVSGTAVRDRDQLELSRVPVDQPTNANVSGTAREKSCHTICDFFSKTESDFAALGRRGAFPLAMSLCGVWNI